MARPPPRGPVFLWVHLYDAHDPYEPLAPFAERFAKEPYDGEIAAVDAAVGQLLQGLRRRRLFDGALLVVLGDHGESLGEHGEDTHGVFLYDATIRVPLARAPPAGRGRRAAGAGSRRPRRRGADRAGGGRPRRPARGAGPVAPRPGPRGAREAERPSYAESEYPRRVFGWSGLASWRAERFLFVEAPRRELYDVRSEPGASRDLAAERVPVVAGMAAELDAARRAWTGAVARAPAAKADPELFERLASLGYAAGATRDATAPPSGIDPKDKIGVTNILHDASLAAEDGRWDEAIPLYERVVSTDPQIFTARLELGLALARRGQWARALPHLKVTAEREPGFADARFTLGLAYARLGRRDEAIRELRAALEIAPRHRQATDLLRQLLEASPSPPDR